MTQRSILSAPSDSVDSEWYRQLKPLLDEAGETFVLLMPSDEKLQRQHDEFIASGYTTLTDLYPEVPGSSRLDTCRTKLETLRSAISVAEDNTAVREAYANKIDEQLLNIDMILAAKSGNNLEFQKANQALYDTPNYAIFAAACSWVREQAQKDYGDSVSMDLRDEVLRVIPDVQGNSSLLFPSSNVFDTVKKLHFEQDGYIEQLFASASVGDGTFITPETGDSIVRQVIKNIGSTFELVDSPSGLWSVLHSKRQVTRPVHFRLTKAAFIGIVSHEIGSHLLESRNGAVSSLQLLQLGLDRYEHSNEGRAFLREQIMYETIEDYVNQPNWKPTQASWEYRVAIHMIISLASGLHGRAYDFAELYHLLTVLFRFWTAKRGEHIDERTIHAGAWSMATRALKGTDGKGGAYLKDIVYLEGNITCWQIAKQHPEMILYGDKGKFNIANSDHVRILTQLGILPSVT